GWHNNHHHDQTSASNQHRWWELDLTYYEVLALSWIGLASDVKRPRHLRQAAAQAQAQPLALSSPSPSQSASPSVNSPPLSPATMPPHQH
ncbi:MAG TPA: hypothetical protein DEB06_00800, partial [Phycisphaerales bacterium]|nr:hypothetical protein [Phycisphaerales bacterium]